MHDPTMRVLTVLELLQARERVSAADLARAMEVSVRSVQRYVARLQDLGLPVEATRGPGATYRLRPGHRLPPLLFTGDEALVVSLGLASLDLLQLSELEGARVSVRSKLDRVLPTEVRDRARRTVDALELGMGATAVTTDATVLVALAGAVDARRTVRVRYRARGDADETLRELEPLGLLRRDGRWFLAAYCRRREERRLFRVDRVRGLDGTGELFERPAEFDLRAFVHERLAFAAGHWRVDVTVGLTPAEVIARLPDAHLLVEADAGGTRIQGAFSDLEELAAMLLFLRARVIVRAPQELRAAFRAVAERATRLSADDDP